MAQVVNSVSQTAPAIEASTRDAKVNSADQVDHLIGLVGSIVVASGGMDDRDHARVRRVLTAAADLMMSRDRLQPGDRELFETSLRDAVARRHGI